MSDHRNDTPSPPEFDPDSPLRATYYNLRPEDRAALEHLAGAVLELTREAEAMEYYRTPATIPGHLRAAAADLRHLAGYLAYVGGMPDQSSLANRQEYRWCELAGSLAPRVGALAAEIEAAIQGVE